MYNTLLPAVMFMFCCCIVVRAGEIDVFVWVSFWLEELPIFTFTFMHLADAFIQSDLQCIQAIHVLSLYDEYLIKSNVYLILLSQIWNKNIKYDV